MALNTNLGKPYWRQLALATFLNLFAIVTALAINAESSEQLILTVALAMAGGAALVPWEEPWQMALAVAGVGTVVIGSHWMPIADPYRELHWLAIGVAVLVGHFAVRVGEQYRKELEHRVVLLDANHNRLLTEMAAREQAVAASESTHQRLRESEAKLRKIFETSTDSITINRVSDGRYLEVNDGFRRLGFSREAPLGQTSRNLGIWNDRDQMRRFVNLIETDGVVANFPCDVRAKDGEIRPFLVSATVVELGGEECVVSIARDITTFGQAECDLIAAREQVAGQVEALPQIETRLLAEIAERRLAQERATSSAEILRGIFDTTQVGIAINRASDGRFLRINDAYADILGYSRDELLPLTLRESGIVANRGKFRAFLDDLEQRGAIPEAELDLRSRNGTVHPMRVSAVKLEIDGASCIATIACAHTQGIASNLASCRVARCSS
jgi:PAS domain S-box-containing protein